MTALLTTLAPIALQVFGWWMDKIKADKEARRRFLELADGLGKQGIVSAKLRQSYQDQLRELDEVADGEKPETEK